MGTIRHHARINRPPDDVWKVVADWGTVSDWFPMILESSVENGIRHCTFPNDGEVEEEIVTVDADRRRFQYRVIDGNLGIEDHLGTIDVLEDDGGSLVIYSIQLDPDSLAEAFDGAVGDAVSTLKEQLEG